MSRTSRTRSRKPRREDDAAQPDHPDRRLRQRFDAIARETGVTPSFIPKFVYNSRDNPRIQTIQPLLDLFEGIERGERKLPEPDTTAKQAA